MAIAAIPILPVKDSSANGFVAQRIIEEATQTFLAGTPVAIAADGGIKAWVANTQGPLPGGVVGIAYEAASNLAATGTGAPQPMQPFAGVGAVAGLFGSVPNQPSAVNIAHGAPINDGRVGIITPGPNTVYSAIFGNAGNTATPAVTNVGKQYGLTLDSNSKYWYVDSSKTTAGTNTVLTVVGLDPRDVPGAGTRVLFVFLQNVIDPLLVA
jgi:hypothetical protein